MSIKNRKIAAHEVEHEGKIYPMHVVVLADGLVTDMFPLTEEIAATEWLGGKIELHYDNNGFLKAYQNNKRIE